MNFNTEHMTDIEEVKKSLETTAKLEDMKKRIDKITVELDGLSVLLEVSKCKTCKYSIDGESVEGCDNCVDCSRPSDYEISPELKHVPEDMLDGLLQSAKVLLSEVNDKVTTHCIKAPGKKNKSCYSGCTVNCTYREC